MQAVLIVLNIPLLRMGRVYIPRETLIEWKEGGSHSPPTETPDKKLSGVFLYLLKKFLDIFRHVRYNRWFLRRIL